MDKANYILVRLLAAIMVLFSAVFVYFVVTINIPHGDIIGGIVGLGMSAFMLFATKILIWDNRNNM